MDVRLQHRQDLPQAEPLTAASRGFMRRQHRRHLPRRPAPTQSRDCPRQSRAASRVRVPFGVKQHATAPAAS